MPRGCTRAASAASPGGRASSPRPPVRFESVPARRFRGAAWHDGGFGPVL